MSALAREYQLAHPPYPTYIHRTDDGFAEVTFLVNGDDRFVALRAATEFAERAARAAEIELGPISVGVRHGDEPRDPNDVDAGADSAEADGPPAPLEPDDVFARAWAVEDRSRRER